MRLYILLLILALPYLSIAQVGIGNLNPDTTSVLDLSNTESKGLLLPSAIGKAEMSSSNKMLYFLNNDIFLKQSGGYMSLSPWKFKFNNDTSDNVYYNLGGYIGIGSTDITITPEAPLQIVTLDSVSLVDNGSLIIGKSNATNIVFNDKELQTRNIASPSDLKINEDGGDILIGKNTQRIDVKINGDLKELHHPTNEYGALVPAGMIIMWYGDTLDIPIGWALCNGNIYRRANDIGDIQSPDLRGKFVVAAGNNGTTNYSPNDIGGQDSVTLSVAELPKHTHNVRDLGHTHGYFYSTCPIKSNTGGNSDKKYLVFAHDDTQTTDIGYMPMTEDNVGGGKAHENRPPYYTLVYIIKL